MSFSGSNAGMETSTPLINAIITTLCSTRTQTSIRCRLKSFTSCAFAGRLAAPDFIMKYILVMAVR